MTDVEKTVYDLFCKYGELDETERKEKIGDEENFREAFDNLIQLGKISMASVGENGIVKVKWIVDKRREEVKNNPLYYFSKAGMQSV